MPSDSATTSPDRAGHQRSALDSKDRKFIQKAAEGGMAEVELGKLAQSNAGDERVKQFGSQMVADHGKANDELKQIAQSKGVTVPQAPDRSSERMMKSLGKQSGNEFDRKYMADMLKDHEKDLKQFQNEARNGKDPDVRAFAEKTAQVISQHLDEARKINADLRASNDRAAPAGTAAETSATR